MIRRTQASCDLSILNSFTFYEAVSSTFPAFV